MASISARGCYKVAQYSKESTNEHGDLVRQIVTLRSDAKVLRKTRILAARYRDPACGLMQSRCWNDSGYSILGAVSKTGGIGPIGNGRAMTALELFEAWAKRHGYSRDDVKVGR